MTKVKRRMQAQGVMYEISCAVCADGRAPAGEFLDELAEGAWRKGLELGDKKLDQVDEADRFMALMSRYSSRGELRGEHQINGLGRGIWEFKVSTKRLSFFDTDGAGAFVSRSVFRDRGQADRPQSNIWHIPTLEFHLRLADGFPKRGQSTPRQPIDWAHRIREEDLTHDK